MVFPREAPLLEMTLLLGRVEEYLDGTETPQKSTFSKNYWSYVFMPYFIVFFVIMLLYAFISRTDYELGFYLSVAVLVIGFIFYLISSQKGKNSPFQYKRINPVRVVFV